MMATPAVSSVIAWSGTLGKRERRVSMVPLDGAGRIYTRVRYPTSELKLIRSAQMYFPGGDLVFTCAEQRGLRNLREPSDMFSRVQVDPPRKDVVRAEVPYSQVGADGGGGGADRRGGSRLL